eukprot:scaffold228096_cov35-Prasinocladus_malaysianus.AAC.1
MTTISLLEALMRHGLARTNNFVTGSATARFGVQTIQYAGSPPMHPTAPRVVVNTANLWDGPIGGIVGPEAVLPSGWARVVLRAMEINGLNITVTVSKLPEFGSLSQ